MEEDYAVDTQVYFESSDTRLGLLLNASPSVALDWSGLWIPLSINRTTNMGNMRLVFQSPLFVPSTGLESNGTKIYLDTSILYSSSSEILYAYSLVDIALGIGNFAHYVTIRYNIQMRARDGRHSSSGTGCHEETSATVCYNKCIKTRLIERCQCIPFSVRTGITYDGNLPYCTQADYDTCDAGKITESDRSSCIKKCKAVCEYIAYNWKIDHELFAPATPNTTEIVIEAYPVFSPFAEILWVSKSTPEQFLSQAGGLVGGYLGLSGFSILAFIITCFELLRKFFKDRRRKGRENRQEFQLSDGIRSVSDKVSGLDLQKILAKLDSMQAEIGAMKTEFRSEMARLEGRIKGSSKRYGRW